MARVGLAGQARATVTQHLCHTAAIPKPTVYFKNYIYQKDHLSRPKSKLFAGDILSNSLFLNN